MRGHAAVRWLVALALVWVVAAWPASAQHHFGHGGGHHFGHLGGHHFGHVGGHHLGHLGGHYLGHGVGIHLHLGGHHLGHRHYGLGHGLHHSYYRSYYYGGWYGYGWPGYDWYPLYYWPAVLPSFCSPVYIWQPIVLAVQGTAEAQKNRGDVLRRRPAGGDVVADLGPGRQAANGQDPVGMMNVLKAQELAERARGRRGEARQNELARFLNIGRAEGAEKSEAEATRTLAQLEADARHAWQSRRYRDAADRYEELVEREPGRLGYWLRLGFSALDAQDWKRSLAAFRSAARLKGDLASDDFDLAVWYGDSSLKLRQLDQVARAALRQPDNPDLWLLVGTFLWFDGQTDRASRFLAKAQDLSQADQPLLLVQAMTH